MTAKKLLFIQPGKLGDLIVTTPIAQTYRDMGCEIYWPVFDNFKNYFDAFDGINSFTVNSKMDSYSYYKNKRLDSNAPQVFMDAGAAFFTNLNQWFANLNPEEQRSFEIVDFCFTFPGHGNMLNNQMTQIFTGWNRNWIDLKYYLANIPLKNRWSLSWNRNREKEQKLHNFMKSYAMKKYGSEKYSIVHRYENGKALKQVDVENPISFSYIKGYEIYDWYEVLLNAESIVCVDSCLANFVEVVPQFREIEKHYLGSEEHHFHAYMRIILVNNWINHSESDISYNNFQL